VKNFMTFSILITQGLHEKLNCILVFAHKPNKFTYSLVDATLYYIISIFVGLRTLMNKNHWEGVLGFLGTLCKITKTRYLCIQTCIKYHIGYIIFIWTTLYFKMKSPLMFFVCLCLQLWVLKYVLHTPCVVLDVVLHSISHNKKWLIGG
jgi:hypothetical protein